MPRLYCSTHGCNIADYIQFLKSVDLLAIKEAARGCGCCDEAKADDEECACDCDLILIQEVPDDN